MSIRQRRRRRAIKLCKGAHAYYHCRPERRRQNDFCAEYLSADERSFEFVNADEIASEPGIRDFDAARLMLRRIDDLIEAGADFVVETTLASLGYAHKIPNWRRRGYLVSLVYLRLDSVEAAIARVRKRVAAGGHDIPENTIRRRFGRSENYFETIYRPIVDEWYIWASQEGRFLLIESWDGRHDPRT